MDIQNNLIERFVRYVKIDTPVNPDMVGIQRPTNPAQLELSRLLVQELEALNVQTYSNDEGFVIGYIPARGKGNFLDCVAFMAHIDVAGDVPNVSVKPQVIPNYDGKPIVLANGLTINSPELQNYINTPIITTDGSTLLGADDKAGVTVIMELVNYLHHHPEIDHGAFEVVFTPDEEGGDGMSGFPLDQLKSAYAYTVDGGTIGGLSYECYNAYTAKIIVEGVSYHPGSARGRLVNPVTMAAAFISLLPRNESPEATDGYYGCYWADNLQSKNDTVTFTVHLRDHDDAIAKRRIQALDAYAKAIEASFPGGKITIDTKEAYRNMRENIDAMPIVMQRITEAMQRANVPIHIDPIRGGTDGAKLTQMGRPCPNLFTGGYNGHARTEWWAVAAGVKAWETILNVVKA